jgi:hypothetical protein
VTMDVPQAPTLLFAEGTFAAVVSFAGATQSAANGTIIMAVLDCSNVPIEGATISAKQGGVEVGAQQDLSQLQPGAFIVFDVPPGDTVVGATFNGMDLRAHTVEVLAAANTATAVRPGF